MIRRLSFLSAFVFFLAAGAPQAAVQPASCAVVSDFPCCCAAAPDAGCAMACADPAPGDFHAAIPGAASSEKWPSVLLAWMPRSDSGSFRRNDDLPVPSHQGERASPRTYLIGCTFRC
ncbi:MAG: hypothetical protein COV76_05910 [Candidatus Omnitrophica bacterium CG11_big_fil_rev_8_21_14_0_20_64_10]|nr:MAG: hypothetical protein COV76_05910 [Candidatus Omnitrophica bacterium CG11_big_fil_rev_8_21_14_0_20_64_10]